MSAPTLSESAAVVELALSWVVTTALTFAVILLDERFMREERLERAWPPSSRDAAIVAFGVLALPIHFARTRGHFKSVWGVLGIPLGIAMGVLAVVLIALVGDVALGLVGRVFGFAPGVVGVSPS